MPWDGRGVDGVDDPPEAVGKQLIGSECRFRVGGCIIVEQCHRKTKC